MGLVFWVTIVGDSLTLGEPAGPVASDNERQGAGEAADECGGSCAYMPTATGLPVGPEEQVWLVLLQASTIPPPRPSFFEIATSRRGHVRLNPEHSSQLKQVGLSPQICFSTSFTGTLMLDIRKEVQCPMCLGKSNSNRYAIHVI